jgi:hypothetical protein
MGERRVRRRGVFYSYLHVLPRGDNGRYRRPLLRVFFFFLLLPSFSLSSYST